MARRYDDEDARYYPRITYSGYDGRGTVSPRRYDADREPPIYSRIGTGQRARIAIETEVRHAASVDDTRNSHLEKLGSERQRARLEVRRANKPIQRPDRRGALPSQRRHSPRPHPRRHTSESILIDDEAEFLEPEPAASPRVDFSEPGNAPKFYPGISDEGTGYDFKLPPKNKTTAAVTYDYVEDVSFPLDAESSQPSHKPPNGLGTNFKGPVAEVCIVQSQWSGSASDRGALGAQIATAPTANAQSEKPSGPLIKWCHLERSMMSFEEFIAASQSVLRVPEKQRRDVSKLLRDVQAKFERQRQHGRDLEPNCVSDLFVGDEKGPGQSSSVLFLSFPYFGFEAYNGKHFQNLTPGSPMHPLRPLLQAHFHSTSQRRELAQSMAKLANSGERNCLHLSQLWCLILDGDTIITCSRQSHEALCGEAISKADVSSSEDVTRIRVSLGNDRSWLIPVTDKTTWPGFVSIFGESVASLEANGAVADFKVNGESVNASHWSFLVQAAQSGPLGLDLQQGLLQSRGVVSITSALPGGATMADAATTAYARHPSQANPHDDAAASTTNVGDANMTMQLFSYASEPSVETHADSLDNVLRANSRSEEKAAYDRGVRAKASAILQTLRTNNGDSEHRTRLASVAIYLFRFFWPLALDHPIADKYWGAVEQTLEQRSSRDDIASLSDVLRDLVDNVVPVVESLVRDFRTVEQDLQPLPDAYSKAFLHLITVFVLMSQTPGRRGFGIHNSTVRAHVRGLEEELRNGKREVTARLKAQTPPLEDLEICSGTSLLTLVLNGLSQDVMHGKPDVASSYSDYFHQLDFRITEDPRPRSHQESLRFFLQEVEAILSTLQYQLSVLEAFDLSMKQQSAASTAGDYFLLEDALGENRQQNLLDECKARIAGRVDKFRGLQRRAQDLGEWHRNEMETNKDRQENAIMVFTVVTIIFLPLSFVSSVFGMNSHDIRDMDSGQWLYWIIGVPLTILVVVGSLWWAGEFEGFGSWVQRILSRASSTSRYRRIPDPVTYGDRGPRGEIDVRVNRQRDAEDYDYGLPPPARRRTTYPRRGE